MNVVAMARHGLILSQDGATCLRNVFKYLPGLRDTILRTTMTPNIKKSKSHKFPYILIWGRRHGRSPTLLQISRITGSYGTQGTLWGFPEFFGWVVLLPLFLFLRRQLALLLLLPCSEH